MGSPVSGRAIRPPTAPGTELLEAFWVKKLCAIEIAFELFQERTASARLESKVLENDLRKTLALPLQLREDSVGLGGDRDGPRCHARTIHADIPGGNSHDSNHTFRRKRQQAQENRHWGKAIPEPMLACSSTGRNRRRAALSSSMTRAVGSGFNGRLLRAGSRPGRGSTPGRSRPARRALRGRRGRCVGPRVPAPFPGPGREPWPRAGPGPRRWRG